MGPLAALSLAQGLTQGAGNLASGAIDYAYSRRRIQELMARRYGTTEEGKYLKQVGREGLLSEREEGVIASKVSRATAQSAQSAIDRYRASAAMQGTTGSIANERIIKDIELDRAGKIADVVSDIGLTEAQAKQQALSQYASRSTQYEQQREDEISRLRYEGNKALVGGITGAATAGISAFSQSIGIDKQEDAKDLLIEQKQTALSDYTKYRDALAKGNYTIDGKELTEDEIRKLRDEARRYLMALVSPGGIK